MTYTCRALIVACTLTLAACGKDSPSAPTPPPASTRIIRLGGNLTFGNVIVGQAPPDGLLTVTNEGTATLTVSGMTAPCAGSSVTALGATTFGVSPHQTVNVTIRFRPVTVQNCSGTITVNSDATSGVNTIGMVAAGIAPPRAIFTRTGVGDAVFDMPLDVARVRIIGIYNGRSSNFIVRIGGRLIVNELLGDAWGSRRYDGTLLTGGGGVVSITDSSGVQWSFEEVGH